MGGPQVGLGASGAHGMAKGPHGISAHGPLTGGVSANSNTYRRNDGERLLCCSVF